MLGIGEELLDELGIPEALKPAPFPMLPLPKGIVLGAEGLRPWRAYVLHMNNVIENLGVVWGKDKDEAEEAAHNLIEVKFNSGELTGIIKAVGVVREELILGP